MSEEKLNPEQQEQVSKETSELIPEQLGKVSGGVKAYDDDPRNRDHSNKKDDPKDV